MENSWEEKKDLSRKIFETQMEYKDLFYGPRVAIFYNAGFSKGREFYPEGIKSLDLSFEEKDSPSIDFYRKMANKLNEVISSRKEKNSGFAWKAHWLLNPDNTSQIEFIIGATEKYFKENYQDGVEAMYAIDELGMASLVEGKKLGRTPEFLFSDYNFATLSGMRKELRDGLNTLQINRMYLDKVNV